MSDNVLSLDLNISPAEAWALAQYLKRAGFNDYRELARTDEEGYLMQAAAEKLRAALAHAGVNPR